MKLSFLDRPNISLVMIFTYGFLLLTQVSCSKVPILNLVPDPLSNSESDQSSNSSGTVIDPSTSGGLTGEETLDSEEQAFLKLINDYRVQNGLGTLQVSITLTKAASWMANDMAVNNYLAHTDSLLRDAFSRISFFGYPSSTWGENCAAGSGTASGAFLQWKNSPGHNANMLGGSFKVIGIGRSYSASSYYKNYWTTDFGSTIDPTL